MSQIEWLSTKEAARRLGITPRTLYRLIDEGQLPAYKFGRVIRLQEAEVEGFHAHIAQGRRDVAGGHGASEPWPTS